MVNVVITNPYINIQQSTDDIDTDINCTTDHVELSAHTLLKNAPKSASDSIPVNHT